MSAILQGTTPTIRFGPDPEDFSVDDMTLLELTFCSGSTILYKGLEDVRLDSEQNTFSYTFTEEETLMFDPRISLLCQYRALVRGALVGTKKAEISIEDLISERRLL